MKNLLFVVALFLFLGKANAQSLKVNQVQITFDTTFGEKRIVWITAKEENTSFFLVYRSVDGETFEPIARVPARGSSWCPSRYGFTDIEANGETIYKVVLVTMDGLTISSIPLKFYEMKSEALLLKNIVVK